MLIKVILTVLLIICAFWAAFYFAEKKRLDTQKDLDIREKYKNNYDSIFLSDIVYLYRDKQISNIDTLQNKMISDSSKYVAINIYDNTSWKIKLPSEKIVFEAYQQIRDYLHKFIKSAVHILKSRGGYKGSPYSSITIYNRDTLSNLNNLKLSFYRDQLNQVIVYYEK